MEVKAILIIGIFNFLIVDIYAACNQKEFPQFQCKNDEKCIDQELTCNGINDCADGSDESLNSCTNGCLFNTTVIKQGETGQDKEWWYTCSRSRWVISGCVVNDQRFKVGEIFQLLTRQGIFWGKCEKIDAYHYMRQPYGCVDSNGRNIDNGQTFQMNQLFWGTCFVNRTTTTAPELGKVQVNDVKWRITGCNDGTQRVVRDSQEFVWIIDPFRLLGVQIRCRLPKSDNEWPDIKPTGCVVSSQPNSTSNSQPSFKVLRNKCFVAVEKLVYYCTISPKSATVPPTIAGKISTWEDDWLLNITDNQDSELNGLKSKGFIPCSETPRTQPVVPKIPLPPVPNQGQGLSGQAQGIPQGQIPQGQFPQGQGQPIPRLPSQTSGGQRLSKRESKMSGLWANVDMRSSRNIRSLLSPRLSKHKLVKIAI